MYRFPLGPSGVPTRTLAEKPPIEGGRSPFCHAALWSRPQNVCGEAVCRAGEQDPHCQNGTKLSDWLATKGFGNHG